MEVTGRVFVVTGGGNGIGREVVLGLLARGARVAAVDLSADGLSETTSLAGADDRLSTHAVDITDRDAVRALPATVHEAHGQVDGLINVAGIIQPFVRFVDLEHRQMEKVMAVNFWGVVHTTQAFLPHLVQRRDAAVVNVASMGAFAPVPGQSVYGASKAAVMLLTEALYAELRDSSVTVTVVFPGGVATHIAENSGAAIPGRGADAASSADSLTTASDAARQIIEKGLENGSFRVVIGKDARMLDRMSRLSPHRATDLIATRMASLLA